MINYIIRKGDKKYVYTSTYSKGLKSFIYKMRNKDIWKVIVILNYVIPCLVCVP